MLIQDDRSTTDIVEIERPKWICRISTLYNLLTLALHLLVDLISLFLLLRYHCATFSRLLVSLDIIWVFIHVLVGIHFWR